MLEEVASIAEVPAGTPSHWLTYVAVDKLAAANERAKKLGGSILMEAIPVPGIGTFSIIQDPQNHSCRAPDDRVVVVQRDMERRTSALTETKNFSPTPIIITDLPMSLKLLAWECVLARE